MSNSTLWKVVAILVLVAIVIIWRCCCGGDSARKGCLNCPTSSLSPPATCDQTPSPPRNEMPNNEMPNNGLSAASLADNKLLLEKLSAGSLSAVASDPQWEQLLAHDHAPELTKYIVSCALDRCETVKMPDGLRDQFPDGFVGELGLCGATFNASVSPDRQETLWKDAKPTQACLERVSACVLARVNAIEARVPVSLRGDGVKPLPEVPVETMYRENHGTPIQSFKACDALCLWGDPLRRNCDWEPRRVGQCVRGPKGTTTPNQVQLAVAGGRAARVRICQGLYGCDDHQAGAGATTSAVYSHGRLVTFPTHYGGVLLHQGQHAAGGSFTFPCPDNGPLVKDPATGTRWQTGYYSVMVGTSPGAAPLAPGTDVKFIRVTGTAGPPTGVELMYGTSDYKLKADPSVYPATEEQVYTYREGAFFGTFFPPVTGVIFSTSPANTCPPATPPASTADMLSDDQYACQSRIWREDAAIMTARLCAGSSSVVAACFVNAPGHCDLPCGAKVSLCEPTPSAVPAPTVVHDSCGTATGKAFDRPYTTYLSHPCDLFTADEECFKALAIAEDVAERPQPDEDK